MQSLLLCVASVGGFEPSGERAWETVAAIKWVARVRTSTAASMSNVVEEVVMYSFSSCHGLGLVVWNFMSWTWTCCVELHVMDLDLLC
jgi:hypothetical protein